MEGPGTPEALKHQRLAGTHFYGRRAICPAFLRSQVKAAIAGHRTGVCLCKAGCQESTSPTGDVAAGCQFPLKSPGQDSREALNVQHLPHPAGCGLWSCSSMDGFQADSCCPAGFRQLRTFTYTKWKTVSLEVKPCWNEKRTFITALQAAIWLLLFLEPGKMLSAFPMSVHSTWTWWQ